MDVDADRQPAEGEVTIYTVGGAFVVRGTMPDIVQRLSTEEWPSFELAETGDHVVIRSSQSVALRAGTKHRRGAIGFAQRG